MEKLNWDFILKCVSSISGIVALLGLIYQIFKDLNSKRPKYRLEVESFETAGLYDGIFQTITIRNVGNRPMYIKSVGILLNDKKYKGEKIKKLKRKVKKGKIKIDIESVNDNKDAIGMRDDFEKSKKMVKPESMIVLKYEMDMLILVNDPLFVAVTDIEDNVFVSKNNIDREIYYAISEEQTEKEN